MYKVWHKAQNSTNYYFFNKLVGELPPPRPAIFKNCKTAL